MKFNKKRFLNLIRAAEEAVEENFDMSWLFRADCKTPSCILGNYVARKDLQRTFSSFPTEAGRVITKGESRVRIYGEEVQQHFGITFDEGRRLFNANGCGNAQRNKEAAVVYLKRFLEEKQRQLEREYFGITWEKRRIPAADRSKRRLTK